MLRLLFPILKKFSLKIFLRLEELKQNQRTFGSVDGDFIKSNRTKNTSKMLRYLLGLIYYSNTIFGNINREKRSNPALLRAQMQWRSRRIFSRLSFACAHAGYLVIFPETGK